MYCRENTYEIEEFIESYLHKKERILIMDVNSAITISFRSLFILHFPIDPSRCRSDIEVDCNEINRNQNRF